ncbi:MAG: Ig-like domain-containing protein [Candidatus Nealsonbacteria bacterium]|nr:Ig-like domain-containing protein [Candidatus Nealsonbacteria bacterium]
MKKSPIRAFLSIFILLFIFAIFIFSNIFAQNVVTPCSYTYGEWGLCIAGIQTRTYTSVPLGCFSATAPIIQQACNDTSGASQTSCIYNYSEWSVCSSLGIKTRTILSKTPVGCHEIESPVLTQTCVYIIPTPISTNSAATDNVVESGINSSNKASATACIYEYSVWSNCVLNKQTRMIISKSPSNCYEITTPVLNRICNSSSLSPKAIRSIDSPAPAPKSMLSSKIENVIQNNLNDRTSNEWQNYYFGSDNCLDLNTCAGKADPDKDGLNNNEEYRFGTDPKIPDSDNDGRVDADEIQNRRNPLLAESATVSDAMVFESPQESGEIKKEIYQVNNVEMVQLEEGTTGLKISGKALPDIYITIFIYSDPIILTIKTDSDGNWSYILDKPLENGKHEVYVAVTDNTGKITAKSEPIRFIKTAQAALIIPSEESIDQNKMISPTEASLKKDYLIFIVVGFGGLILALAAIGLIKKGTSKETGGDINK